MWTFSWLKGLLQLQYNKYAFLNNITWARNVWDLAVDNI